VLVLLFGSSSNLAAAYGIAVTGTMLITAILSGMVMGRIWGWRRGWVRFLTGTFLLVDGAFFLANVVKIPYGGWLPLVMGAAIFIVLTTWKRGRTRLREAMEHDSIPIEMVLNSAENLPRAKGTAVYLSGNSLGTPVALLHNLKHNQILHERVVLLTVIVENVPFVRKDSRIESKVVRDSVHRVVLHYGFMQTPDIPTALANAKESELGFFYEPMRLSYFVTRMIARPSGRSGMPHWRETIFAWMVTNAATSTDFFNLPMNRVVELGANVEI
jgi:KUP system potassium uptake protein